MSDHPTTPTTALTWAQFKAAVQTAGVQDSDLISYIDTNGDHHPEVERYDMPDGTWRVRIE